MVLSRHNRSSAGNSVKVALVVVGLVLLLIGIVGALYGFFVASGIETSYVLLCAGGQPEPYPGWCAALLSTASTYRTIAYGMTGVFVVGIAMAVAGAVMQERPPAPPMMMPPQPAPPPGPWRACRNCGRSMPSGDRFCPSCGTAQW